MVVARWPQKSIHASNLLCNLKFLVVITSEVYNLGETKIDYIGLCIMDLGTSSAYSTLKMSDLNKN